MERTSSAKLDEMLNFQKAAFDKTALEYDHSLSSCSTSSSALNNVVFVSPASNVEPEIIESKTENISEVKNDKGKSILGAPLTLLKKLRRTIIASPIRSLNQRNHTFDISMGHTRPNCYKCFATQQSNCVLSFGGQIHFQNSLAPFGELLKAVMFLTNFNGFNPPSYSPM